VAWVKYPRSVRTLRPTGYIPGANFGKAVQDNQFPQPVPGTNDGRLFRMAFGFRF